MTNIEIIERLKTAIFTDEEDEVYTLEFQPGLSDDELAELDAQFPTGKLPAELREILKVTKGWEDAYMLETTFFDSIDEFGFDELIPHSVVLGHDGLGNY